VAQGSCDVGAITKNRLSAGGDGILVIEIQMGLILDESDLERFEDDYNRFVTKGAG